MDLSIFCVKGKALLRDILIHDEKTYTHIELLDRFMSGKTSPEEERTLLAWFSDSDHKEEIMAFYYV